jgi:hypothetical protein
MYASYLLLPFAFTVNLFTGIPAVSAAPAADTLAPCDATCQAKVDKWLFSTPIADFYAEMQRVWWDSKASWGGIDWVHWSTNVKDDVCSVPEWIFNSLDFQDIVDAGTKDQPFGFDFSRCCRRHDFGYGNYRWEGRFTEDNRGKIDGNFKDDMFDECNKHDIFHRTICKSIAETYYKAVRACGNGEEKYCPN